MGKSQPSASKKSKKYHDLSTTFVGYSGRDQSAQRSNSRSSSPSVISVGCVGNPKTRCKYCNKFHFGEWLLSTTILKIVQKGLNKILFRLQSQVTSAREKDHPVTPAMSVVAEIQQSNLKHEHREDASAPDVITGTFSLLDTDITTLIDPSSTHSYICMNLVFVKNLHVESTEFVVKVSNPLG
ncbi:DNA/RNA polymerases superfamily protein [Gossypium australe]|uniref:DNA/RNA polymerases superfamily protein n=1 Tax=Gossypium australe TaxID=47621 RepID=A0A5B6UXV4_9ROSI|nr:DNA/RNA polymerases superfamily protein [Gossypium australe]